jgi:hypothetical protein
MTRRAVSFFLKIQIFKELNYQKKCYEFLLEATDEVCVGLVTENRVATQKHSAAKH